MGLEVAFVTFAHIPWAESQFHGPKVVAKWLGDAEKMCVPEEQ